MYIINLFSPRINHSLHDTFETLEGIISEAINSIKEEYVDEELINELEKQLKEKELFYASEGNSFELTSEDKNQTIKVLIGPSYGCVVNPLKLDISISVYYKDRLDLTVSMFTLD